MNPLQELQKCGQSFWLDYIRRSLITSGELERLIGEDGLRGLTSNPTIFEKAIAGSSDYHEAIQSFMKADPHLDSRALFEKLSIEDIQMAADVLKPIYDETDGLDGYVSFELSPHLAKDAEGSVEEARRLWKTIKRPNLMLKVPATAEANQVIETLITEGINVNVTLLFSLSQYEAVTNAYLRGLERCRDPSRVASVASFFVSRIDGVVDKALEDTRQPEAFKLKGRIAIANAKMAYRRFKEIFRGARWERQAERGARVQRLLWASTSTKNPAYSDVVYVEELIGPKTVNTIPPTTINAFRDHGQVTPSLEEGMEEAENSIQQLNRLGVDLEAVTEKLQADGVDSFANSFNKLLSTIEEKRRATLHGQPDPRAFRLGGYRSQVDKRLENWEKIGFLRRLWAKDPTLWFSEAVPEITNRLGWLALPESMHDQIEGLVAFAEEIRSEGIRNVVLLGMGGSSLAPEVFQKTFGNKEGYPKLTVLDSTHPVAVKSVESRIEPHSTLFIVASKSGTTLETLSLFRYFWEKTAKIDGDCGQHFVAISDSGSPLTGLAKKKGFLRAFEATADVGGRYSALTVFGLLPAALIGMDLHQLLDSAWVMSESCAFCVLPQQTSSLRLGAALGELAKMGRNKVTFLASQSLRDFPVWVEQLIAESTGKDGEGIVPVVGEPATAPSAYGSDRLFIYFFVEGDDSTGIEKQADALEGAGHPVIRIKLRDKISIGQEIFSWEIAVASAGSILGIHPFNQPNVQMAKDFTKKMMGKVRQAGLGETVAETVSFEDKQRLARTLDGWRRQAEKGDYVAIQAYLPPSQEYVKALQSLRKELQNHLGLATTLGYGPRFLHSTGQLHKGGPNTGLFLQIVDEPAEDLEVPDTGYTFGSLIRAQALGDFQALTRMGRRVLRVNLKRNGPRGLIRLSQLISERTERKDE